MTITWKECIVHNWKYFPEFYGNLKKIRQTKQYSHIILQELTKRCCSCYDKKGESSFDLNVLEKLCQEIELSIEYDLISTFYLVLEFPSKLTSAECNHKIGQFIGRNGNQLKILQQQFNVYINIINKKSNIKYQYIVQKLKETNKQYQKNSLWIFINKKKNNYIDKFTIEQIKQSLEDRWNYPERFIKIKKVKKPILYEDDISPPVYFDGDTRWKPKKQRARDMK